MGKVASQIGIKAAAFRFTKRLGKHVNESTVRSIKKAYIEALLIRRKSGKVKDEGIRWNIWHLRDFDSRARAA